MIVERSFTGTVSLEEILSSILCLQIDSIEAEKYDKDRANVIPSHMEGVAKQ
ncbi:hypothetical protein [Brevibacillus sp. DP1.3A]|uniref:hypothetical protein n=1 Tax=Brevibacillus sp. DP1.3A TaxID=2738867 RepID=UPI00156BAB42|nr:hypothetical protein [Brevibacillus sp. DP1.3A]MED1914447.1 hypothetical protein [Bacillus thuringiensis]UED74407.1 hypothetical protein HP399_027435 [Brevibacillus sp. DP1.3A]